MKTCKECNHTECDNNGIDWYVLNCPNCEIKERKMEFDRSRIYSAVNADELKQGDKVCVADTLMGLENRVRHECVAELEEVLPDYNEHRFKAYLGIHNLAYLVERAEHGTNCKGCENKLFGHTANDIVKLIDDAPTVNEWHYPSRGDYPTDHTTVILYGKLKYEHEKEYEYFIDVGEWIGNMWSNDLERWSTVNDWYEGQQEYKIIAWMPLPEPPKEEA